MTRDDFIRHACASALQAHGNETTRRAHVADLVATAEAMADALGLPAPDTQGVATLETDQTDLVKALERVRLLEAENAGLRSENAQLEAELEKATTPAAKPGKGGPR